MIVIKKNVNPNECMFCKDFPAGKSHILQESKMEENQYAENMFIWPTTMKDNKINNDLSYAMNKMKENQNKMTIRDYLFCTDSKTTNECDHKLFEYIEKRDKNKMLSASEKDYLFMILHSYRVICAIARLLEENLITNEKSELIEKTFQLIDYNNINDFHSLINHQRFSLEYKIRSLFFNKKDNLLLQKEILENTSVLLNIESNYRNTIAPFVSIIPAKDNENCLDYYLILNMPHSEFNKKLYCKEFILSLKYGFENKEAISFLRNSNVGILYFCSSFFLINGSHLDNHVKTKEIVTSNLSKINNLKEYLTIQQSMLSINYGYTNQLLFEKKSKDEIDLESYYIDRDKNEIFFYNAKEILNILIETIHRSNEPFDIHIDPRDKNDYLFRFSLKLSTSQMNDLFNDSFDSIQLLESFHTNNPGYIFTEELEMIDKSSEVEFSFCPELGSFKVKKEFDRLVLFNKHNQAYFIDFILLENKLGRFGTNKLESPFFTYSKGYYSDNICYLDYNDFLLNYNTLQHVRRSKNAKTQFKPINPKDD